MIALIIDDASRAVVVRRELGALGTGRVPQRADAGLRALPANPDQTARLADRLRVRTRIRTHL